MQIVAKVLELEISVNDVEREMSCGGSGPQALRRLIDRCLLLSEAEQQGFAVSDEEFDIALMELLDEEEPFGLPAGSLQDMDAQEMEILLRRNILIKKYLNSLYPALSSIAEERLRAIYLEQQESFCCEEMVRCSHIFIQGENSKARADAIYSNIHSVEDFVSACRDCSDCPSHDCCGDLGFFAKGKLYPEIDAVAFGMELNQISQPFLSPKGHHILMLTERKLSEAVPYDEIKDSLAQRIHLIEREYFLMRHLSKLYEAKKHQILIFQDAYKQT